MQKGDYEEAIELFETIEGYADAQKHIKRCENEIQKEKELEKKLQDTYNTAMEYKKNDAYEEAIAVFTTLGDYKDSATQLQECINIKYEEALSLLELGDDVKAYTMLELIGDYKNSSELRKKLIGRLMEKQKFETLSTKGGTTVGLKSDGTVVAVGNNDFGQCNVEEWNDIVTVSSGNSHTVGLKSDGTVVAVGNNDDGQCNVESWRGIVAVSAGGWHTVGLKSDGTVVAVGDNVFGQCNVEEWTDIVAVSAGRCHTVGLKSDGTVVAVGDNDFGQCEIYDEGFWTSITYHERTIRTEEKYVEGWNDIVAVSAGDSHTVGLKSDGTVVVVGDNYFGQCNVEEWTDIKVQEFE